MKGLPEILLNGIINFLVIITDYYTNKAIKINYSLWIFHAKNSYSKLGVNEE
jgi:hypothetical protein